VLERKLHESNRLARERLARERHELERYQNQHGRTMNCPAVHATHARYAFTSMCLGFASSVLGIVTLSTPS
jgi:hypothetical protein